jgi:hypothetical protein
MAAAKKDSTVPKSDFVSRMLQSAAEPPEKKEPNQIKESPEEIEKLTKNLKDKWSKGY